MQGGIAQGIDVGDGGNTARVAAEMAQLKSIDAKWIRIEVSTTAESSLLKSPACPKLPPRRIAASNGD
jgi:hypothetical protein